MLSVDSSALLHANIPKHVTFFNFVDVFIFMMTYDALICMYRFIGQVL